MSIKTRLARSLVIIILLLGSSSCMSNISTTKSKFVYRDSDYMSKTIVSKYKDSLPIHTVKGDIYCSASAVRFLDAVYTVTNNHCCSRDVYDGKYMLVGGYVERILHRSKKHDICVATSVRVVSGIRMSPRKPNMPENVSILGWPLNRGFSPRPALLISEDNLINIGNETLKSNIALGMVYAGDSGSAVLNNKGEMVGMVYAKFMWASLGKLMYSSAYVVPLRHIREAVTEAHFSE